jgi:hypothetical protein
MLSMFIGKVRMGGFVLQYAWCPKYWFINSVVHMWPSFFHVQTEIISLLLKMWLFCKLQAHFIFQAEETRVCLVELIYRFEWVQCALSVIEVFCFCFTVKAAEIQFRMFLKLIFFRSKSHWSGTHVIKVAASVHVYSYFEYDPKKYIIL